MRTKTISRFDAGLICYLRIQQAREGTVLPLSEFGDQLLRDNNIAKPIRRQTLWRILTGRYYPELKFEGEPIDFSKMPENVRGDGVDTKTRHALSDLKSGWHQLHADLHESRSSLLAEINALKALVEAQAARITALEAKAINPETLPQ